MHELAAVQGLVEVLLDSEALRGRRVEAIRVRRGSAFSEEALSQGFEALARGTALEGARLEIEVAELVVACPCGQKRAVTADDLIGHMYVCADCGSVRDVAEADDLELVEVRLITR
jgi:Zn finger protein HypA/HybF involved in hydrogenase expression